MALDITVGAPGTNYYTITMNTVMALDITVGAPGTNYYTVTIYHYHLPLPWLTRILLPLTYLNHVHHNIKEIRFAQGLHLILTKLHLHHYHSFIITSLYNGKEEEERREPFGSRNGTGVRFRRVLQSCRNGGGWGCSLLRKRKRKIAGIRGRGIRKRALYIH
jgi:hypothetical protein